MPPRLWGSPVAEDPKNPFSGALGRGQPPAGGGLIINLRHQPKWQAREASRVADKAKAKAEAEARRLGMGRNASEMIRERNMPSKMPAAKAANTRKGKPEQWAAGPLFQPRKGNPLVPAWEIGKKHRAGANDN